MDSTFIESLLNEALYFAILFTLMYIAQKLLDVIFNKYFTKLYTSAVAKGRTINKKRYETLASALRGIASVALWTIAIFVVLAHFNVNYAALLTGAGAVGLFFSIAAKDVIMDIYVGMMVLLEDQYRVGDVIKISDTHKGTVEEITLRTVRLRDEDGAVHIVPHSMARSVINKTFDYAKVNVELGVSADTDVDQIKKIIDEVGDAMVQDNDWKTKITEPLRYQSFLKFDESQITVRASGKVKPGKQWAVDSEFRIRIKKALEDHGIALQFKQSK